MIGLITEIVMLANLLIEKVDAYKGNLDDKQEAELIEQKTGLVNMLEALQHLASDQSELIRDLKKKVDELRHSGEISHSHYIVQKQLADAFRQELNALREASR